MFRVLSIGVLRNVYGRVRGVGGWAVAGFNGRSGLYEGVKDGVREYCLRVIEVVVFSKFSVDMEFLYFIEVCSFFVAVYNFRDLVHGAKWASSIRCLAKLEVLLFCTMLSCVLCSGCPTYTLWQSGQVNLYMPEWEYLSWA